MERAWTDRSMAKVKTINLRPGEEPQSDKPKSPKGRIVRLNAKRDDVEPISARGSTRTLCHQHPRERAGDD